MKTLDLNQMEILSGGGFATGFACAGAIALSAAIIAGTAGTGALAGAYLAGAACGGLLGAAGASGKLW